MDEERALTGRHNIWTKIGIASALVTVMNLSPMLAAQSIKPVVQAEISHLGETAHLEFKGLKTWHYDLQKDGTKKIVLTVPPLDQVSLTRLQGYSDALVRSVAVNKNGADGNYAISFELAEQNVESFDYLTDEPSRLIVDFYRRTEPEVKKPQASLPKKTVTKAQKKSTAHEKAEDADEEEYVAAAKPTVDRKPAGDEFLSVEGKDPKNEKMNLKFGIYDGGDDNYDRFRIKDYEIREEATIASRQNFYLPFPMLKMQVSLLDKLMEDRPEYVIHPKDDRQNKEARLLLTLFERNRYAVFLRTFDYFRGRYPESEYSEILKCLAAHVHLKRWKDSGKSKEFEDARALYSELVQKYPESPLREHNFLILGFALMERGEALTTLQTFQDFINTYPTSPEIPLVRNAVAEAYMILRKFQEASEQYGTIIKDFPKTAYAREARYRMGDVAFTKGDYSEAIRIYEAAIKGFPSEEKVYPNASFNMAEARFWQKDYKSSLGNYIKFVNLFPTNGHGGYALTRIGELLGILGADQRRVMGAFLESYFRFPNNPGAKVARIRMLSQQMKGMKPKELKKALAEIEESANTLDLRDVRQFTTLMASDGLASRSEYKAAIENLIGYYQKNPSSGNLGSVKSRILRNIASELKEEVERGDVLKALGFYSQFKGTWLKNSDRIDVPYLVAGAYERAGAYGEAEAIYRETLQRRQAIVGTDVEKEKKVQEHLPSVESLNLRLASTLAQDRNYIDAYQRLKSISPKAELTPAETIERVQLSALIAEQRNDPTRARDALNELAEKWRGDPKLLAPVQLQLAGTFLKLGEAQRAEAHADLVLQAAELPSESEEGKENLVAEKVVVDAYQVKAEAQMAQKKSMAAVETYQKLLDRYEDKLPLASVRYKVGQILFDRGDLKGAADVWKRLAGTKNDLLWKVGKEKLDQSQWQDEYNKYIKRIPAMVSTKKESKQ